MQVELDQILISPNEILTVKGRVSLGNVGPVQYYFTGHFDLIGGRDGATIELPDLGNVSPGIRNALTVQIRQYVFLYIKKTLPEGIRNILTEKRSIPRRPSRRRR